jgi:hypothetical protein
VFLVIASVSVAAHADDDTRVAVADRELGVHAGIAMNLGGVAPGGLYLSGEVLYRLTDTLWFDGRAGFTIGSSTGHCTFPMSTRNTCDSALLAGFGFELLAGIRWWLATQGTIAPYIALGANGDYSAFSGDDLSGLSIPFWGGFGVRTRLNEVTSLGAEVDLDVGGAHYDRDIAWEGFATLRLTVGAEFAF